MISFLIWLYENGFPHSRWSPNMNSIRGTDDGAGGVCDPRESVQVRRRTNNKEGKKKGNGGGKRRGREWGRRPSYARGHRPSIRGTNATTTGLTKKTANGEALRINSTRGARAISDASYLDRTNMSFMSCFGASSCFFLKSQFDQNRSYFPEIFKIESTTYLLFFLRKCFHK